MDSLTQAALGAAVGHICWHEKMGRKALVAGALLGTIPDLDILLYPFLDEVQRLYWHRGESHSVWFLMLGSIGLGWLFQQYYSSVSKELKIFQTSICFFLILSTHVLIDLFNVYGTQLLAPISRKSFALNNMFILDPLFTFPLLAGTIGAYLAKKKSVALWINQIGLLVAVLYAAWSFSAQAVANQKFRLALAGLDFKVSRQITSASPCNTLLWRHIAETSDGFLLGYWSWLDDKDQDIRFQFIPRNAAVVEQIKSTRTFAVVEWFSKGWWYAVKNDNTTAKVVDLRFTEVPPAAGQPYTEWQWLFAWTFQLAAQDETRLKAALPDLQDPLNTLKVLGRRIGGQGGWLNPVN
jgi:inner membrane protein